MTSFIAILHDGKGGVDEVQVDTEYACLSDLAQRVTRLIIKHDGKYYHYVADTLPTHGAALPKVTFMKGILLCA